MDRDTFKPGEYAPRSGMYRVVHYAHRIPHDVTVEEGGRFPKCARCAERVRFVYLQEVRFLHEDYDLRPPQRKAANGG